MSYRDSIIEGVESENVEEINDAYKDMIDDLGTSENFLPLICSASWIFASNGEIFGVTLFVVKDTCC